MNFGNILAAIEAKFGTGIDLERVQSLYHKGDLKPMLPDGCCWVAEIDTDEAVESIEASSIADAQMLLRLPNLCDGAMILKHAIDADDNQRTTVLMFPNHDAAERLTEARDRP